MDARADNGVMEPLVLYGYETSPFVRPVREKLCQLGEAETPNPQPSTLNPGPLTPTPLTLQHATPNPEPVQHGPHSTRFQ